MPHSSGMADSFFGAVATTYINCTKDPVPNLCLFIVWYANHWCKGNVCGALAYCKHVCPEYADYITQIEKYMVLL